MEEQHKTYRVLDGTVLKIIAMISMVFDHVGDMFFPDVAENDRQTGNAHILLLHRGGVCAYTGS